MKKILFISSVLILLMSNRIVGQSTYVDVFSLKISSLFSRSFSGEIESGDIEVVGTDGDTIRIVAEVYNAPGKNYTCKQNDCMVVDQNLFHFSIKPRQGEKIKKIDITLPKDMSISLKILGKGSVNIKNIDREIQIISNRIGNFTLKEIVGPLSVSTTYGDVDIEFAKGISKKTMAVSLVKGNIRMSFPKGEAVTFASSCFEEKSTLKDQPINQSKMFKLINGTVLTGDQKQMGDKRNMIINAKYIERIETRKFIGKGIVNAKDQKDRKAFRTKEDVYMYDVNGGGTNIELNIYQGSIRIDEKN